MPAQWKPKGWIAILLGLILQPFVFLYVNKLRLFFIYLVMVIFASIIDTKLQADVDGLAWYKDIYFSAIFILICPVHAFLITRNYNVNSHRRWYASWWAAVLTFVGVFVFIVSIRAFIIEQFTIPASSMSPTLKPGSQILVSKLGFGNYRYLGVQIAKTEPTALLERGDIVVFQYPMNPQSEWVKRVIGLEGDTVIYRNKTIYLRRSCEINPTNCTEFEAIARTLVEDRTEPASNTAYYRESIDGIDYEVVIDKTMSEMTNRFFSQKGSNHSEWTVPKGNYFVLGDSRDNSLDSRFWGFVPKENITGKVIYIW